MNGTFSLSIIRNSILHEVEQFQVSSIHLIYKSTCLIHDYCNIHLKQSKKKLILIDVQAEWSTARVSFDKCLSIVKAKKVKFWFDSDLCAYFSCFANPVKSSYPLCNEKLAVGRQKLLVNKLGVITTSYFALESAVVSLDFKLYYVFFVVCFMKGYSLISNKGVRGSNPNKCHNMQRDKSFLNMVINYYIKQINVSKTNI